MNILENYQKFFEFPNQSPVSFNVKSAFDYPSNKLGEGSFGKVYSSKYKTAGGKTIDVAIKKLNPHDQAEYDFLLVEISASKVMANYPQFCKTYGCSFQDNSVPAVVKMKPNIYGIHQNLNYVHKINDRRLLTEQEIKIIEKSKFTKTAFYVVQEKLDFNLDSDEFKTCYKQTTEKQSLELWLGIIKGLQNLWNEGMTHNDLKPDNLMSMANCKNVKIIDLGMVWIYNQRLIYKMGTPRFMSPKMYSTASNRFLSQMDDLYSIAITIADIESKGYNDLFGVDRNGKQIEISCFKTDKNKDCIKKIARNAREIFTENNYGEFSSKKINDSEITFTTLMTRIAEYYVEEYTYDRVINILTRLIEEEAEKQKGVEIDKIPTRTRLSKEELDKVNEKVLKINQLNDKINENNIK